MESQREKSDTYTVVVVGQLGQETFTDVEATSPREAANQIVSSLSWPQSAPPRYAIAAPEDNVYGIDPGPMPKWQLSEEGD